MGNMIHTYKRIAAATVLALLTMVSLLAGTASAAVDTTQNPQSGSVGLEGRISTTPPTRAATIATPTNGASFTATPVTVAGLCPSETLVKIFSNNVFVGSALCERGSYSLQIDLFSGTNQLVARVYDALDQAGPDSNIVTVTFNDAQFAQFGTRVTLTSQFARRGAFPGAQLSWPLNLQGGVGPYAISVDWGDGSAPQLLSRTAGGAFDVSHAYTNAGYYKVTIRATDRNGTAAFLQVVAVANGAVQANAAGDSAGTTTKTKTVVLWWPLLLFIPLLFIVFWLGRRHEIYLLQKRLEDARRL